MQRAKKGKVKRKKKNYQVLNKVIPPFEMFIVKKGEKLLASTIALPPPVVCRVLCWIHRTFYAEQNNIIEWPIV